MAEIKSSSNFSLVLSGVNEINSNISSELTSVSEEKRMAFQRVFDSKGTEVTAQEIDGILAIDSRKFSERIHALVGLPLANLNHEFRKQGVDPKRFNAALLELLEAGTSEHLNYNSRSQGCQQCISNEVYCYNLDLQDCFNTFTEGASRDMCIAIADLGFLVGQLNCSNAYGPGCQL